MTDWAALRDGIGDPAAVPALIEALASAPSQDLWMDIYDHLCHQDTVYSASFAAIPLLHRTYPRLSPSDRRSALILIGAIMASTDRSRGAAPDEAVMALLPDLMRMTEEAMGDADVDEKAFSYLLQAALAFRGDALWHPILEGVASNGIQAKCPACEEGLYVLQAGEGYAALGMRDARNKAATRTPVIPASADALPRVGACLHGKAVQHGMHKTANAVTHIFGEVGCPKCGAAISVAKALLRTEPNA